MFNDLILISFQGKDSFLEEEKNMFFRKHSFKVKIISLILFFSLIPILLVNLIWYRSSTNSLADKIVERSESLMKQLDMNLGNFINNIGISVISVAFDEDVEKILFSREELSQEAYEENYELLQKELTKVVYNNLTISRISLLTDAYQVDSTGEEMDRTEIENRSWYQEFKSSGKIMDLTEIYYKDYGYGKQEPTIAYLQRIMSPSISYTAGVIIVEMRYAKIKKFFNDISGDEENQLFVFDNHNIIYSPDGFYDSDHITDEQKKLIDQTKKMDEPCDYQYMGRDYILIKKNIASTGWTVVELIDKEGLFSAADSVGSLLSRIILAFVVVLIFGAFVFVYRMLKPLSQMEEYMKKVEQNQFDVRFTDLSEDEFGRIKMGFNKMIEHIDDLLHDIEKKETEKREIAIKALKAQINPHFLYNTLNIIRWRAVMAGNETIGNMIVTLIHTMEFNGKRKEEFVTIKDEIDNVKNYVQLLKYHYENKFNVTYDLDHSVMDFYVCKLILQPLVENSVFHGIIPKKEMGEIRISVKRQDNSIVFSVKDNGVGMNREQESEVMNGIGLSNVNDRICYYFGSEHRLTVENVQGKGVNIHFSVPIIKSLPYERMVMKEEDKDCVAGVNC